jgi:periplasmic protein TonB
MASMSGTAPHHLEDQLFRDLVVSNPPPKKGWFGVRESLVGHAVVIALMILVPILWPSPAPEHPDYIARLFWDPPPPPPPPLPKGNPDIAKVTKPAEPTTPEVKPVKPEFTAPIEHPKEQELKPEARLPETEQAGSLTGSDFGVNDGMEDGVEGGVVGGVPGGVLGGVIGGTGDGPVMDYDQPPRPIKITRPQYPQEAFVKKIEGEVIVEILIDSTGAVVRARVIQSIPALDAAAVQTVKEWRFAPAVKNGRPVSTIANAPVRFRIF